MPQKHPLYARSNRPLILSHKDASRVHFAQRFGQRQRLMPTGEEIRRIVKGILLGQALKLTQFAARRNLYAVAWRGKVIGVVYDWALDQLITVLPDDDPRVIEAASRQDRPLQKWLQESAQAAKGAAL
jgi:hypothetical protein